MARLKSRLWVYPERKWKAPVGVPPPLPPGKFAHCDGQLSLEELWSADQSDAGVDESSVPE